MAANGCDLNSSITYFAFGSVFTSGIECVRLSSTRRPGFLLGWISAQISGVDVCGVSAIAQLGVSVGEAICNLPYVSVAYLI